jgi:sulfur carrier protein ThiS
MFVKIAKLGAAVVEVMINEGSTVEQALSAAAIEATGFQVRVNGRTPCGTLADKDTITLVPAVKGGSGEIMVKVAKLGTAVKEVMLGEGSSVNDALEAAEMEATGFQVRVNGREAGGACLRSGDVITLVPAVKGGN